MAYEDVEGEGGLWSNKLREDEPEKNHPHLTGKVLWEGRLRRLGAYVNLDKDGKKWMKIYMSEFKKKAEPEFSKKAEPDSSDPLDDW